MNPEPEDTSVVEGASFDSVNYDAFQAMPFESSRVFAIELTGGGEAFQHTVGAKTQAVQITLAFTSADSIPYVNFTRGSGDSLVAKRLYERDYTWTLPGDERVLNFVMPGAGSAYVEIVEA